jgi:maltooligosyltrehalose trehalohydrolase
MTIPGAEVLPDGSCTFTVWAPQREKMELKIVHPTDAIHPMRKDEHGYWNVTLKDITLDTRYFYRIDGTMDRPDPASRLQPNGVHEASQVVSHLSFQWSDQAWKNIDLASMVLYELHVGTFTPEGTFNAVIPRLDAIAATGINAIELMPVAQFPGERNWGYDGAYPFAVQNSYGGPEGLKRMVDACHRKGIAVVLDVVFNHFGPEGCYVREFGPYFTNQYKTPWGDAINFDGPHSDQVRTYFIQNALMWFTEYHIDGLRLDAIHGIYDTSARPFLQWLAQYVEGRSVEIGRRLYLIAESDLNDIRVITPRELGGYGFHAQWSDDLHHSMQTLLKSEEGGYYVDFGRMWHLAKGYQDGFVYSGQYSPYRKKSFGNSSRDRPAQQFIVCTQNHDQVGNRLLGERLSVRVSFEASKLAASIILLSPFVPLLFMGEEYADENPFLYFVSHSDSMLIEAIRKGRKEEFGAFNFQGEPLDAAALETFQKSKLRWESREQGRHGVMLNFYKALLRLRRENQVLKTLDKERLAVSFSEIDRTMVAHRWNGSDEVLCLFNLNESDKPIRMEAPAICWKKIFDSSLQDWQGPGPGVPEKTCLGDVVTMRAQSAVILEKEKE